MLKEWLGMSEGILQELHQDHEEVSDRIEQLLKTEASAERTPLFKEILDSQIAFARRATQWEQDTVVNRRMAFDHYFGANGAAKKL